MRAVQALGIAAGLLAGGCDSSSDRPAQTADTERELLSQHAVPAQQRSALAAERQVLARSFFDDLREAFVLVLEDVVRPSSGLFSVSLATEDTSFPSLPDSIWNELSARLTARGEDVTGYVKAEELFWQPGGRVIHRATRKGAVIFHIMAVKWVGDQRLFITHSRTTGSLGAIGYTTVLEKDERGWRIVDRIHTFTANYPASGSAGRASQLAIGHQLPGVPGRGRSPTTFGCP